MMISSAGSHLRQVMAAVLAAAIHRAVRTWN
jgi:hypothetical protein